jgi:hypothetical protein
MNLLSPLFSSAVVKSGDNSEDFIVGTELASYSVPTTLFSLWGGTGRFFKYLQQGWRQLEDDP